MLAAAGPLFIRTPKREADAREALRKYLHYSERCGSKPWADEYQEVDNQTGEPTGNRKAVYRKHCSLQGCPVCSVHYAKRQLVRQAVVGRFRLAYGGKRLRLFRLNTPLGAGPEQAREMVEQFRRGRKVRRLMLPSFAVFMPDDEGVWGLTVLTTDALLVEELAELWVRATGGTCDTTGVKGQPFELAAQLRAEADGKLLELVGAGIIDGETGWRWRLAERNKHRTLLLGGFRKLSFSWAKEQRQSHMDSTAQGSDDAATKLPRESKNPIGNFGHTMWRRTGHTIPLSTLMAAYGRGLVSLNESGTVFYWHKNTFDWQEAEQLAQEAA